MIFFEKFFQSSISTNLIAALLHSLWQAACIAALLYIFLRTTSARKPNSRYIATLASMLLLLLCLITTFAILQYQPTDNTAAATISSSLPADSVSNPQAVPSASVSDQPKQTAANHSAAPKSSKPLEKQINWRPWALAIWLTGVCVMLIRAASMAMGLSRLCRSCKPIDDPDILAAFHHLCASMNITRKITLLTSSRINIPCVIGAFRPAILLPASIITGIPADDLSAILAHELAHIRRHDYLINFCQMIIEAVLFFNPAMWWISRQLRIEREACCDAVSIAATGKKLTYARALANFAQHIAGLSSTATTAVAFGKPENPNSLLDRIKRILITDHRPHLRISWPTTLLILIASIVVIFALQKTTNATVKYIGKILTPEQRIEKIEQLQKEYAPAYNELAQIPISGNVSTIDGKCPTDWRLSTISGHTHASIGSGGCGNESEQKTTFKAKVYPGKVLLYGECPGYANFMMELDLEQGDFIEGIPVVFDHGYTSSIEITDEQGNPIPDAAIKANYKFKNSGFGSPIGNISTGPDGIAVVENAIEYQMQVNVIAPGYEKLEGAILTLLPDQIHTLVLKESTPTSGIILDAITGLPVPDAEIRIVKKDKPGHGWDYGINATAVTTSDQQGVFTLASLETGAKYQLLITAPNHGYTFMPNIRSGQDSIDIILGPPTTITGKIIGDLSKLSGRYFRVDGERVYRPEINVNFKFEYGRLHSGNDIDYVHVTIEDGIGYFKVDNLLGNSVKFQSGSKTLYGLNIIEGKYDYDITIDLDAEPETRKVVVNLTAPEGMPAPTGKIHLQGIQKISGREEWVKKTVVIENGTGSADVPVPVKLSCRMQAYEDRRLLGYWFKDKKQRPLIESSDQPYEFNIEVIPAGSVYGYITDMAGNKVHDCDISIKCTEPPEGLDSLHDISSTVLSYQDGEQGAFNAFPLPLGGKYRLTARCGNYSMIGPEIKLTEENPIAEYNFVKGESIDITGRILDHDSTPIADAVCRLRIGTPDISYNTAKITDSDGVFTFPDINSGNKATYQLEVDINRDGLMLSEKFELKLTDQRQDFKLKHIKTNATITGSVVDADTGQPIAGVTVEVSAYDKQYKQIYFARKIIDNDGKFEIPIVKGHQYNVGIRMDDVSGYNVSYSSKSVKSLDEPVLFEIKPPNSLSGTLIDVDSGLPVASQLINGHCKYSNSKSTLKGGKFNPITDANGKFSMTSFGPDIYVIDEIPGYTIISTKQVKFSKGERNKNIEIKVRKN